MEINRLLARALQTAPPEYVTGGKDLRSLGRYPAASVSLSDVCADNDGNCVMGSLTGDGYYSGAGGLVWVSANTPIFTETPPTGSDSHRVAVYGIAYTNGTFVAICGGSKVSVSKDGQTWKQYSVQNIFPETCRNMVIAAVRGLFVIVQQQSESLITAYSYDGITWYSDGTTSCAYTYYLQDLSLGYSSNYGYQALAVFSTTTGSCPAFFKSSERLKTDDRGKGWSESSWRTGTLATFDEDISPRTCCFSSAFDTWVIAGEHGKVLYLPAANFDSIIASTSYFFDGVINDSNSPRMIHIICTNSGDGPPVGRDVFIGIGTRTVNSRNIPGVWYSTTGGRNWYELELYPGAGNAGDPSEISAWQSNTSSIKVLFWQSGNRFVFLTGDGWVFTSEYNPFGWQ